MLYNNCPMSGKKQDTPAWVGVLALIGFVLLAALVVVVVLDNRNQKQADRVESANVIRQQAGEARDLLDSDPTDPATWEGLDSHIDSQKQALSEVEIKSVHGYTPKTDIGRRYKSLVLEAESQIVRWGQAIDCQLTTAEVSDLADDSISLGERSFRLTEDLADLIESGQATSSLGVDVERLAPALAAKDVEIYELLPPGGIEAVVDRCGY